MDPGGTINAISPGVTRSGEHEKDSLQIYPRVGLRRKNLPITYEARLWRSLHGSRGASGVGQGRNTPKKLWGVNLVFPIFKPDHSRVEGA